MKTGIVLLDGLLGGPRWVLVWVTWLCVVNLAGAAFLGEPVGRWVFGAFALAVGPWMLGQAQWHGFTRLLALPHLAVWTPLVVAVSLGLPETGPARIWAIAWLVTTLCSLALDANDLRRWVRGERAPA